MIADACDVVVVGSGYGGSIAALRLAQAGRLVCVLERGRPYAPGTFPRRVDGLAAYRWDPAAGRHGLYELCPLGDGHALVASGLGGGSLIDGGVLVRRTAANPPAPDGSLEWDELAPHYDAVEDLLRPRPYPSGPPYADSTKGALLKKAAEEPVFRPPLAIAFAPRDGAEPEPGLLVDEPAGNLHGRPRYTCRLVGECVMGCNYGAKASLDLTCLSEAQRLGADLRPRCEVTALRPGDGGWEVEYARFDPALEGRPDAAPSEPPKTLRARHVVLAAGALGTTALLLRARDALPRLSPRVGAHVSTRADLVAVARADADAGHGPTFTTALAAGPELTVLDGGRPDFLAWLLDAAPRVAGDSLRRAVARGLPLVAVGGRPHAALALTAEGRLALEADGASGREAARQVLSRIAGGFAADGRGSAVPAPSLMLHPLGGCPIGRSPAEGVVDPSGNVFGYPGLHVADGSLICGPVGGPPALSIAALADRVAGAIVAAG